LRIIFRTALALFGTLGVAAQVTAATRFWDGGGTNRFWDVAVNWSNNVAPVNGDALVFPANATQFTNNNRASGNLTGIASLRITGNGYDITSIPLNLTNGITEAAPVGSASSLGASLQLRGNQAWLVNNRNTLTLRSNVNWNSLAITNDITGTLVANGNLVGVGLATLVKTGPGRLELNGASNQIGSVSVQDGTLQVDGRLGVVSTMTVFNGATLSGTGSLTAFSCAGDFEPGGSGAGALTLLGAGTAQFTAGSRFFANLNGLSPGVDYDQFKATTPPILSGATLLVLRSASFPFALGQQFVIITNTGTSAQLTAFANLPQDALLTNNGVVFQISYTGGTGNDVELTVVATPFAPTGQTRIWDAGAGDNRRWNSALNWDNNTLPQRGDDLVFPGAVALGSRTMTNDLDANVQFNRLRFDGKLSPWLLRGNSVGIFGGLTGTEDAAPSGSLEFQCAAVELLNSQSWALTNYFMRTTAPLLFRGHTLTLELDVSGAMFISRPLLGPGAVVMKDGFVTLPPGLAVSNLAVRIDGGAFLAGRGQATGSPWQLHGGDLRLDSSQIPGLVADGGRLSFFGNAQATIAGDFTLGPASSILAVFEDFGETPFVVTGNVTLDSPRLEAGPIDFFLLGSTFTLIRNDGTNAVHGTFAGLPESAFLSFTNESGDVFFSRISYTGGDGNDVTLTPGVPPASGLARIWTGAGPDAFWTTALDWSGQTPPGLGDDVLFPVNAPRRANTNELRSLLLNSVTWEGSNYLHAGGFSLIDGLHMNAVSGTNTIALRKSIGLANAQTWSGSASAATLRLFSDHTQDESRSSLLGVGPLTKTGPGVLALEDLVVEISDGLNVAAGTLRVKDVFFNEAAPLHLLDGRLEIAHAEVTEVTALDGKLSLQFSADGFDSLHSVVAGNVTLSSNVTMVVEWAKTAFVAITALQLNLGGARLDATFPPDLEAEEIIRVAQYHLGELTGEFANLPNNTVTNIAGRTWQIRYEVAIPGTDSDTRFITLGPPTVPPRITAFTKIDDITFSVDGTATLGDIVTLEASEDLVTWTALGTVASSPDGFGIFVDISAFPHRFFRLRVP